jgi:hypothetical protein
MSAQRRTNDMHDPIADERWTLEAAVYRTAEYGGGEVVSFFVEFEVAVPHLRPA